MPLTSAMKNMANNGINYLYLDPKGSFGDKRKMFKSIEKHIPKSGLVEFKHKTFKKALFCMFNGGQSVIWLYKKYIN